MEASERKRKIMDATMRIVAEKGLESFAVLQAAKLAHVNEALVYRDLGQKRIYCLNATILSQMK